MSCSDGCFPRAPNVLVPPTGRHPETSATVLDRVAEIFIGLAHRLAHLAVHFPNLADAALARALALQFRVADEPARLLLHGTSGLLEFPWIWSLFMASPSSRVEPPNGESLSRDGARQLLLVLINTSTLAHEMRTPDTLGTRRDFLDPTPRSATSGRSPPSSTAYAGLDVNQDSSERSVSNRKRSSSESFVRVARGSRSQTMRDISATIRVTAAATSTGAERSQSNLTMVCRPVGRSSARAGHSHRRIVREWRDHAAGPPFPERCERRERENSGGLAAGTAVR